MNQALEIINCLQTGTAAELDALLPSILDKLSKENCAETNCQQKS
jgi:hypothetical protein